MTQNLAVIIAVTLLVAVAALWWWRRAHRRVTRRPIEDVLSEGAAPAARNEALIAAAPAAAVAAPPASTAIAPSSDGDDLTRIKGVGPKLVGVLAGLGVTRFAQIAAWSEADLAGIDAQLGAFAGRPARDAWIEQASLLASGDVAAYEARFGKL